MTATSPYRPTASSPSAMDTSCVTRRCGHEYPDDVYPEVPAAEQKGYCGDYHWGNPVCGPNLVRIPAGCELPEDDDRPRDTHDGELARPVPRRAVRKGEIYHRKQRCPNIDVQRLARERHLWQPQYS